VKKEVLQVIKFAADHGFTYVGRTGSGHAKLRHTGGQSIIVATSPNGGNRWKKNTVAMIHRINSAQKDKP
jgi:predicted RNA binding protein YcfA (HicA-like mRNA interferase family)